MDPSSNNGSGPSEQVDAAKVGKKVRSRRLLPRHSGEAAWLLLAI